VLLKSNLFNPCLQNLQQAIEKYIKAVIIEKALGLTKSHSIRQMINILSGDNIALIISDDDVDLIDSVYIPSKYPVMSVLPEYMPTAEVCKKCLRIAQEVRMSVINILEIES